jgi:hypothetical protein
LDELTRSRLERNEAVFREANEQIRRAAREIGADREVPFICECDDTACTQVLLIPLDRYQEVRSNPEYFIHARGHVNSIERVIEEDEGFVVVEKDA